MHSKALSRRWLATLIAAAGLIIALQSVSVAAEDSSRAGFVYVMTNKSTGNSVIQYGRSANGSLTWLREVATGGNGTGPNGADPLGSQNSLVLGGEGKILLGANAGSNEVSVLEVTNGKLVWRSKSASGGTFPNSMALFDNLVYVLNAQQKPEPRRVLLGITDGATTEVVSGDLKQGDAVIIGDNTQIANAPASVASPFGPVLFGGRGGGGGRGR